MQPPIFRAILEYMAKKKAPNRSVTVNVRIYADTHKLLREHADKHHQTISGLIHQYAATLSQ